MMLGYSSGAKRTSRSRMDEPRKAGHSNGIPSRPALPHMAKERASRNIPMSFVKWHENSVDPENHTEFLRQS